MSARSDNERLRKENDDLIAKLAEAQADAAAHMANVQRLTPKAGRTDEAEAALVRVRQDRDDAWKRVRELEQQVTDRDGENVKLVEANRGLIIALGALGLRGNLEAEEAS